MEKKEKNLWLEQYSANYNGKSAEAKEIASYLKETYKGDKYVPWATMERLTYMQDPNAEFKTILTDRDFVNGDSIVHTDSFTNENSVENKDGIVNKTSALVVSHFVKVSCTFLGKTFVEEYPIQDQDYTAAKIYNQNLVNKALKRALAKVASRATGLGLKLYENIDLQFDEKEEEKPVVKKTNTKKSVEKPIEPKQVIMTDEQKATNIVDGGETYAYLSGERTFTTQDIPVQEEVKQDAKVEENASYSNDILELCKLIKNAPSDKMTMVLQNLNVAILKQHNFVLSQTDTDEVLCEKLTHFKDVSVFTKAITNMLG